jgi:hypothetical protein
LAARYRCGSWSWGDGSYRREVGQVWVVVVSIRAGRIGGIRWIIVTIDWHRIGVRSENRSGRSLDARSSGRGTLGGITVDRNAGRSGGVATVGD